MSQVATPIGSSTEIAYSVAVQSDGKIVAAGYSDNGSNDDFALARYNTDGSLDATFGSGGKVATPVGSSNDYAYSVAIQSDGKIVAAGLSSNGSNDDFALARYDSDGSLDTGFGTGGKVTTAIGSAGDYALSVAIQSDGKIVAAGYSDNGSNYDFALARYLGGPSATSLSINAPTKVPGGSKAKITGTLSSSDPACRNAQQVMLEKGSSTIGPKTTDASGAYEFKTKITKKTKVRVTYAGTPSCNPSASAEKTIRVT